MRCWVIVLICLLSISARSEVELTRSENKGLAKIAEEAERLVYANPQKLDSAIFELRKAAQAHNDSDYIMMARLLQGISYTMKNNFAHGLKEFFDVYQYAKSKGDTALQINALNDMGGVYMYSNKYQKAVKMFNSAIALVDKNSDQYLYANLSMAMGMSYTKMNHFDSAQTCLRQSLKIFKVQNEMHLAQSCMNELAYGMERQKKFREALDVYNSMLALYPHTEDARGEIVTHQRKGNALMQIGRMAEAVSSLESSLVLADSMGFKNDMDTTIVRLIKANAALGNIAQAEHYANRLIHFVEDREANRNSELMAYVESKYSLEEQERINASLVEELHASRAELSETRLYLRFAAAGVVILLLSMIVLYRRLIISTQKVFE